MIDRDFRDQHHVDKIRERLWVGREIGRAAVMVGAGFSRNAERSSPEVPIFPLLGEIAGAMFDELYPPGSMAEAPRNKDKARRIASATRLASEYETTFGRQALDDLLKRTIIDERYEPGAVHQTLLSLPWSDVFTTNYDTLLERTRTVVHERKYDLILASSDIPAQSRPRIVKLHGSFPSHGPYVITEEDFRTYPTQFATFVNLVQQSIMENAFCLLGFSGDDPNFLSWTGWVRDNLGSSVPPVYLAGLLNLSGSQRRLLEEARSVTPIDLSPLFPASDWPDPLERHNRAMEWFLLNLAEGQPPKVDRWPVPSPPEPRTSSEGLPRRPEGPRPIPDPGPRMPRVAQQTTARDLEDLLEKWSAIRKSYPGWQLAPYINRAALWDRTELWIQPVLESARQLGVPQDLFLLFELNWRLEKSLVPLFSDWAALLHSSLEAYNPFPSLIDVPDATIRPDVAEYRDLDWDRVAWQWVDLAFALARAAREGQDEADFRYWMDLLSNLRGRRSDWRARWFYEQCLFHLSRLDQVAVRSTLDEWTEDPSLPLWQVKRAAILIELGDLEPAEQITERAVETVRSRMQPYEVDRTLMSHEALALMLLEGIKANDLGVDEGLLAGYRDRLQDLERYGCNPWAEIERLEGTVVGVAPPLREWRQDVVPAFDPGRQTVNVNMPGGFSLNPLLPAFALLRLVDEGALLPRVGSVNRFPETLLTAANWIEPLAPLWSFTSMIRQAKEEEIRLLWNRAYVATLHRDTVDRLVDLLLGSLEQSIQHLATNPGEVGLWTSTFSERQVKLASELLSRLSIRCSDEQRERLFDLARSMYEMPLFREHPTLLNCPKTLFARLLNYGLSRTQTLRRVPDLLSLPVLGEAGFVARMSQSWIELTDMVRWDYDQALEADLDKSSWDGPVINLNRMVRYGSFETRHRAASRLAWLLGIGGLTDQHTEAFGDALWSRVDERTGLPSETSFPLWAFLSLPEPELGRAKVAFRRYVLGLDFERSIQQEEEDNGSTRVTVRSSPGAEALPELMIRATVPLSPRTPEDEQNFIDWSFDEALELLRKVVSIWDNEKQSLAAYLTGGPMDTFGGIGKRIEDRLRLLSLVVLPRIAEADEDDKTLAERLVSEIGQMGVPVSFALPAILYVNPGLQDEVATAIVTDMGSGDESRVGAAASGVFIWTEYAIRGTLTSPPTYVLDKLINGSLSRSPIALDSVLSVLRSLLCQFPEVFNERQLDAVGASLENLLEDTQLPERSVMEGGEYSAAPLSVEWRPNFRWRAAQLAYCLSQAYAARNADVIPEVLRQWEQVCREDPLPEVRAAWDHPNL